MTDFLTISKTKPQFPPYLNFQTLRELGINHLQALSGKLWTDYNLHDPGVTILEALCYAITDLGYRTNFAIEDLLALDPKEASNYENNFFTPDQILTCNPLTDLDWRKCLIDIHGVRNAWLETLKPSKKSDKQSDKQPNKPGFSYEPAIYINWSKSRLQYTLPHDKSEAEARFNPRGLYRVWLDLEPVYDKNPCGHLESSISPALEAVNQVLGSYRNLCEDIHEIAILEDEEIALCSNIELTSNADPEDVLVEIYVRVQAFLMPRLQFYTLQELLDKGKSPADIFAGRPVALAHQTLRPSHGFVDVEELEALTSPTAIYTSDLYREILQVPGVAAVHKLSITNYINGLRQSKPQTWALSLRDGYRPTLGIDHCQIMLYKGALPLPFDSEEVKHRYFEQQEAAIKVPREAYELDLPVPQGNYYDTLADHYSVQHEFPLTYGIGEAGLPNTVPPLRKAQAKQLKGYLAFFDQLLANYLAQLAHGRDLFSWEMDAEDDSETSLKKGIRPPAQQYTSFTQPVDFPGWEDILTNTDYVNTIEEDRDTYRARRNRLLDHLLARFAESFTDYALLNYQVNQLTESKAQTDTELINDKARFLQAYPTLGRDRMRAFDYSQITVWNTSNISGFEQRVCRLLGINPPEGHELKRTRLSHYHIDCVDKRWTWSITNPPGENLTGVTLYGETLDEEDEENDQPWLASLLTYTDKETARADLKQCLTELQAAHHYQRLTYRYAEYFENALPFSFAIINEADTPLAFSPRRYSTPEQRDQAMEQLLVLAADLSPDLEQYLESHGNATNATYLGRLTDENGTLLLQGRHLSTSEVDAWHHSNDLMEWAEDADNYQLIDSDGSLYGWELTSPNKERVLAIGCYKTSAERDAALTRLHTYIQETYLQAEGLHLLEHILLRPRTSPVLPEEETTAEESTPDVETLLPIGVTPEDAEILIGDPAHLVWQDPYSFWVSVIVPYWPTRFASRTTNFRQFVERTLHLEAPAHIALRIIWVGPGQMKAFEDAYGQWLEQLALSTRGPTCKLTATQNRLIEVLRNLRSVFPEARLYDPLLSDPDEVPVVLNQTALGTAEE